MGKNAHWLGFICQLYLFCVFKADKTSKKNGGRRGKKIHFGKWHCSRWSVQTIKPVSECSTALREHAAPNKTRHREWTAWFAQWSSECQLAASHRAGWVVAQPKTTHHEFLHTDGEGCRVEQDLPVLGQEANDIFDEHHKILRQQLVSLRGGKTIESTKRFWGAHGNGEAAGEGELVFCPTRCAYFIHHHHLHSIHSCHSFLDQIQNPARRGNDDMH